jgi:hypothetical protein
MLEPEGSRDLPGGRRPTRLQCTAGRGCAGLAYAIVLTEAETG